MDDGLGESSGPRSEEEDSLRVGFGRSELEIVGALLSLSGLLEVIEQLDVQTGGTGLVELTGSDLVGQPDGLDRIGSQEGVEVLNVSLAVVKLSGEVGKKTRDEAGAKSRPDSQHVILVGGQVDDNDRLLASGGGTDGGRTEGGHECVGHSLDGGLEPCNIVGFDSGRRGNKGERSISIVLSSPCERIGKSAQVAGGRLILGGGEGGRDYGFDAGDGIFAR